MNERSNENQIENNANWTKRKIARKKRRRKQKSDSSWKELNIEIKKPVKKTQNKHIKNEDIEQNKPNSARQKFINNTTLAAQDSNFTEKKSKKIINIDISSQQKSSKQQWAQFTHEEQLKM